MTQCSTCCETVTETLWLCHACYKDGCRRCWESQVVTSLDSSRFPVKCMHCSAALTAEACNTVLCRSEHKCKLVQVRCGSIYSANELFRVRIIAADLNTMPRPLRTTKYVSAYVLAAQTPRVAACLLGSVSAPALRVHFAENPFVSGEPISVTIKTEDNNVACTCVPTAHIPGLFPLQVPSKSSQRQGLLQVHS